MGLPASLNQRFPAIGKTPCPCCDKTTLDVAGRVEPRMAARKVTTRTRTITYEWATVDVSVFVVCRCGFEVRCRVEIEEDGRAQLYPLPDTAVYPSRHRR